MALEHGLTVFLLAVLILSVAYITKALWTKAIIKFTEWKLRKQRKV